MSIVAEQVKALTKAHTRIVWSQQQAECEDFYMQKPDFKLMGLDTEDGKGEREIMGKVASYATPMFTPRGDRIVFTDNEQGTVNVVNFDGTGHEVLGPGYVMSAWRDPADGKEYVFVRPNNTKSWVSKSNPVVKHELDDFEATETVWTKTSVSWNWFALSPDGTRVACSVPWPICGMASIPDGEFVEFDRGCWTSMAPDDSHRMWVFDGDHRHVKLFDEKGTKLHALDVHQAPGVKDWEIYHPRWSNNVRFFNVTGPYSKNSPEPCREEDRGNWIKFGGFNVELYLGKLDEELKTVEEFVKITDNEKADFMADTWIAPA